MPPKKSPRPWLRIVSGRAGRSRGRTSAPRRSARDRRRTGGASGLRLAVVGTVGGLAGRGLAAERRQPPALRALAEERALAVRQVDLGVGEVDRDAGDARGADVHAEDRVRTALALLALQRG